jgi:hypothetical protein
MVDYFWAEASLTGPCLGCAIEQLTGVCSCESSFATVILFFSGRWHRGLTGPGECFLTRRVAFLSRFLSFGTGNLL